MVRVPAADGNLTVKVDCADAAVSFSAFKTAYPRNLANNRLLGGASDKRTRHVWDRLTPADRAAAILAAPNYADDLLLTGRPVQNATTWLRGAEWQTYADPPDTTLGPVAVALAEVCGIRDPERLTGDARRDLLVAARGVEALDAGADAVRHVAREWAKKWPELTPGPLGLLRNWHRFSADVRGARSTGPLCGRCGQERDGHDLELCQILGGAA